MGGRGSGGTRIGAGRKPWKNQARVVAGGGDTTAATPEPRTLNPEPRSSEPSKVARPKLSPAVRAVWDALAPQAVAQGTLVPATAFEFRTLCELAVEQKRCLKAYEAEGFTDLGMKMGAHYRGLTQRLETKLRAFRLAPMGRELAPPAGKEKPLSPLEQLKRQRQNLHAVK